MLPKPTGSAPSVYLHEESHAPPPAPLLIRITVDKEFDQLLERVSIARWYCGRFRVNARALA
jgi:hypothetical protein